MLHNQNNAAFINSPEIKGIKTKCVILIYKGGAVHCHQLKYLDWRLINVRFKENVPQYIVDKALARIEAIFFE